MSLARIHIAAFLLVLGLCNAEKTTGSREIKVNDSSSVERAVADNVSKVDIPSDTEEEEEEEEEDIDENILPPILPPLILLDFDNGTSDDNVTTDEKSKRTVNDGLGYGFGRNSLVGSRKYNYYFPAGKTGTTVSIEESISPFLPRTIIEKLPAGNQKLPVSGLRQQESHRTDKSARTSGFQSSVNQYYDPATQTPQVFGLRMKLTKTPQPETYGGFSPIARPVEAYSNHADYREGAYASTTQQPLVFAEPGGYVTPRPQAHAASSSSRYAYVTASPEVQHSQRYLSQSNQHAISVHGYARPAQKVESSTSNSPDNAAFLENVGVHSRANPHEYIRAGSNAVESSTAGDTSGYVESVAPYADLPRYTVEDGVRYENKIFWKYPDGRVSDVPPMTYETYSEYPSLAALQAAAKDAPSQIYEAASTESSVSSRNQGPVQFPTAPEPSGPPTPFVSAESLSSNLPQQHAYRLGYQNLVSSQKQIMQQQHQIKASSGVLNKYTVSSTTPAPPRNFFKSGGKSQKNRYETLRQPVFKYMVNSPNAEYVQTYTTENILRTTTPSSHFISSAGRNSAKKTNADGKNLENYSSLQYADLLNYNPSISQYIKNPASILNVQPTFVQAGSSLIPVIILRVDGVPPIQPKVTPNINLKALLQQYLVQYARSLEELARPSNYDLGNDQTPKDQSSYSTSPLRQLARLAQNHEQDLVGNPTESYIGKTSYETSNLNVAKVENVKYGERTAVRPKVKSVQIVEDPRFPNYRAKN
nr:PREDICTED: uncharacterized protein LOC105674811 [Linepithema humile]